jgi:hypothetical protein
MTIFTIAAVVIVIGWFTVTAFFWECFKEDEQAHPIYREKENSVGESNDTESGKSVHKDGTPAA